SANRPRRTRRRLGPRHDRGHPERGPVGGDFEIGRILHLKSEIRDLKLDGQMPSPIRNFEISDLRCRIRPISNSSSAYWLVLDGSSTLLAAASAMSLSASA